ncbi:MAG TPA: MEDS domain-containing protein [Nitrosopumilaceae archaeon]|jgi:hypothetical protein|nr:MEDS domain-containing protein [Nitrosopumilaceae archaeon]
MAQRLQVVEPGDHVIAIYPTKEIEFAEAFEFLRTGLVKNEIIMLITDKMSKDEIRKKMIWEWKIDFDALDARNTIIIKTAPEWYFPHGSPDADKISALWHTLVDFSRKNGKSGIRIFTDTTAFFEHGFTKELILYESTMEKKFDFPLTTVCGYTYDNIDSLTSEQFSTLKEHHNLVWI